MIALHSSEIGSPPFLMGSENIIINSPNSDSLKQTLSHSSPRKSFSVRQPSRLNTLPFVSPAVDINSHPSKTSPQPEELEAQFHDFDETPKEDDEEQERYMPSYDLSEFTSLRLIRMDTYDPISSISVTNRSIAVGTMFGRILVYYFESCLRDTQDKLDKEIPEAAGTDSVCHWRLPGTPLMLAGHSDDSIRFVYHNEETLCAIVGNNMLTVFDLKKEMIQPPDKLLLDARIAGSAKFVLGHHQRVLVPSTGVTVIVDVGEQSQHLWPFRLPGTEMIPMDFNGSDLIAFCHGNDEKSPAVKVLAVPVRDNPAEKKPSWGVSVQCLFHKDLPGVSGVAHAKFWMPNRIAIVPNGKNLLVYEISSEKPLFGFRKHRRDIVALDCSQRHRIISISADSILFILDEKGCSLNRIVLTSSIFSFGYPYVIGSYRNFVFYSCDRELRYVHIENASKNDDYSQNIIEINNNNNNK